MLFSLPYTFTTFSQLLSWSWDIVHMVKELAATCSMRLFPFSCELKIEVALNKVEKYQANTRKHSFFEEYSETGKKNFEHGVSECRSWTLRITSLRNVVIPKIQAAIKSFTSIPSQQHNPIWCFSFISPTHGVRTRRKMTNWISLCKRLRLVEIFTFCRVSNSRQHAAFEHESRSAIAESRL